MGVVVSFSGDECCDEYHCGTITVSHSQCLWLSGDDVRVTVACLTSGQRSTIANVIRNGPVGSYAVKAGTYTVVPDTTSVVQGTYCSCLASLCTVERSTVLT